MNYKKLLDSEDYNFIKTNEHLGRHIILLGLSGSFSYGTENADSDIDIRGIALNQKSDIIGMTDFQQYVDDKTDTVIYGFNKIIPLLLNCNPNIIELLGLNPEHYLYLSDVGKELIQNSGLFLSKRAIQSFGGYADAQLRRLQNALARDAYPQREKEQHILNSVRNAMYDFRRKYSSFENGSIRIYTDKAENPELDTEMFMDACFRHYPVRDYKNICSEMNNIIKEYDKLGKRNKKKDNNHLNKHAMHLIRLFMMAIDILQEKGIRTYRREEQALLLAVRNGEYQKEDGTFREEFYDLVSEYERKLNEAARQTALPDEPDMNRIQELVMRINERVVRDEI